jgi:hypothetical protein
MLGMKCWADREVGLVALCQASWRGVLLAGAKTIAFQIPGLVMKSYWQLPKHANFTELCGWLISKPLCSLGSDATHDQTGSTGPLDRRSTWLVGGGRSDRITIACN